MPCLKYCIAILGRGTYFELILGVFEALWWAFIGSSVVNRFLAVTILEKVSVYILNKVIVGRLILAF